MTSNEHKSKLEPAIALIINFRPFENKLVCNKQTFITVTSSLTDIQILQQELQSARVYFPRAHI